MISKSRRILSLLLLCAVLFGSAGCREIITVEPDSTDKEVKTLRPTDPEIDDTPVDAVEETVASVDTKDKPARQAVDFLESRLNVAQNQEFYVDLSFDVSSYAEEELQEILSVYIDVGLREDDILSSVWEVATNTDDSSIPHGHSRLYIRPDFAARPIWPHYQDIITFQDIDLDKTGEHFLRDFPRGESWGFLSHYYLVMQVDAATGERLERPQVTIFTLEPIIEAPKSEFFVTQEGHGGFRWEPVSGADYYLIVRMSSESDGDSIMHPIGQTTDTEWIHPEDPHGLAMNQLLAIWGATADTIDYAPEGAQWTVFPFQDFAVIAVGADMHSAIGTLHRGRVISARLPYLPAWSAIRAEAEEVGGSSGGFVPAIGLMPAQRPISLANGRTVRRNIIYDFEGASFEERGHNRGTLTINYFVEGTVFGGDMLVSIPDASVYQSELEEFREFIENGRPMGGGTMAVDFSVEDDIPEEIPSATEVVVSTEDRIFANTALSEFLAVNLLAVNEAIDLSQFPESADWTHLLDALLEAMYQNPLAMHVVGAGSIPGSNLLVIEYRESAATISRQQAEIRAIIPRIVSEIITAGMSDLEKSFAINRYLIDNSEYDWAALEEAERNNFQSVDARFNDSFTAYGILINGVGVCSGYADAFKLLADAAGLESIVVTGYLEGTLPHAWNRVNINGQWHTVDVTNNANEFLFNAFLNLPDSAAGRLLVEDDKFMMNDFIDAYRSNDNSSEYYNVTGRLFNTSEVATELATQIRQNGRTTLRTDYDLDDETFYEIAIEVMEILGTQDLFGFYMLGVIWMSDSP